MTRITILMENEALDWGENDRTKVSKEVLFKELIFIFCSISYEKICRNDEIYLSDLKRLEILCFAPLIKLILFDFHTPNNTKPILFLITANNRCQTSRRCLAKQSPRAHDPENGPRTERRYLIFQIGPRRYLQKLH